MTALTDEEKIEFAKSCRRIFAILIKAIKEFKSLNTKINFEELENLKHIYISFLIINYAKPFSSNNFKGKKINLWSPQNLYSRVQNNPLMNEFEENELILHNKIINLRNQSFAHNDDNCEYNQPKGMYGLIERFEFSCDELELFEGMVEKLLDYINTI